MGRPSLNPWTLGKSRVVHLFLLSSVQVSFSVVSDYLRPYGLQHARLPCPSPTPRACSNPCPSNQWCHPTISSSVVPFSSCLQSFPASGSFPMSQFFASSGQSIGVQKASVLRPSTFIIVQLSHPYMTTGKTTALTRWTFVGKVMSLLFNMLFRLVIAFLTKGKRLLISWLQSPAAVILEHPPKIKSVTVSSFPIYLPWSDGTRCHDLSFLNVEL